MKKKVKLIQIILYLILIFVFTTIIFAAIKNLIMKSNNSINLEAKIEDTKINVVAEKSAIPKNSTMEVKDLTNSKNIELFDEENDKKRDVIKKCIYNISLLDENGNEIEPDITQGDVNISFENELLKNNNIKANIYHITDEGAILLDSKIENGVISAKTDSFSVYYIEFIYASKTYILNEGESVLLSDILDNVGLSGNNISVESSTDAITITEQDGEKVITVNRYFDSAEYLNVKIDDLWYKISLYSGIYDTDINANGEKFYIDSNNLEYIKFIPENTGYYTFQTFNILNISNACSVYLYDANKKQIDTEVWSNGANAYLSRKLIKGTTYYWKVYASKTSSEKDDLPEKIECALYFNEITMNSEINRKIGSQATYYTFISNESGVYRFDIESSSSINFKIENGEEITSKSSNNKAYQLDENTVYKITITSSKSNNDIKIKALGIHHYDEGTITLESTCSVEGKILYKCIDDNCDDTYIKTTSKLDHTYGEWIVRREPTCTESGWKYRSCTVCNANEYNYPEATGHDYSNWTIKTEEESKTIIERVCKICNITDTRTIHKDNDIYPDYEVHKKMLSSGEIKYYKFVPDISGYYTFNANSSQDIKVYRWNEDKTQKYSSYGNGKYYQEYFVANTTYYLSVEFTDKECSGEISCYLYSNTLKEGEIIKTSNSGEKYTFTPESSGEYSFILDLNERHAYSSVSLSFYGTNGSFLQSDKEYTYKSTLDGKVIIKKNLIKNKTYYLRSYQNIVGDTIMVVPACNEDEHDFNEWTTTKEATCIENEEKERTCKNCGYIQKDIIYKEGHIWNDGEIILEATDTTPGKIKYTCTKCGDINTKESLKKDGWNVDLLVYDNDIDNGKTAVPKTEWEISDGRYDKTYNKVITMQINYKNSNCVRDYEIGDVSIIIPKLTCSSTVLRTNVTIGANDSTHTGYEWNVREGGNNTYVITNAIKFYQNTNFEGNIQIIYTLTSNPEVTSSTASTVTTAGIVEAFDNYCIHSLNQDFQAKIYYSNNLEQYIMETNNYTFKYERKYEHIWKKVTPSFSNTPSKISTFDGLEKGYTWVKYSLVYNTTASPSGYSGLNIYHYKGKYEYILKTKLPEGCIVRNEKAYCVYGGGGYFSSSMTTTYEFDENNMYTFRVWDNFTHSNTGANKLEFYVGYPEDKYSKENCEITNTVDLYWRYRIDNDYTLVKTAESTVNLKDYIFTYDEGSLYNIQKKGTYADIEYRNSGNPNNYQEYYQAIVGEDTTSFKQADIFEYQLKANALYTGDKLTLKLGDDILYALEDNEKYVKLKDNEYEISAIWLDSIRDGNADSIISKNNYELYIRYEGESSYVKYDEGNKNTYDFRESGKPIVGFYWTGEDIDSSVDISMRIFIKLKKKNIARNGNLYNYDYLQVFKKDENGALVLQNKASESNYSKFYNDIKEYDIETYGHYMQRAEGNKKWEYFEVLQPKVYMSAQKSTEEQYMAQDIENEKFSGSFTISGGYLAAYSGCNDEYYHAKYKEEYDEKYFHNEYTLYDLLPMGMTVDSTKDEILNSMNYEKDSYTCLVNENFEEIDLQTYLQYAKESMKKDDIVIEENWHNTGRTLLKINVNLGKHKVMLFTIKESYSSSYVGSAYLTFKYKTKVSFDNYYEYGDSYKNDVYVVKGKEDNAENSKYTGDEDIYDFDEDGDTTERFVKASATEKIISVMDTHQDLRKFVLTDKSNYDTGTIQASEGSSYSYKIRARTGENSITNLIIYDSIEQNHGNKEFWIGEFEGIDTSYAENKGYVVKVYWSENKDVGNLYENGNINTEWKEYNAEGTNKKDVKALAFEYYDSDGKKAVIPKESSTYVVIKMKAPDNNDGTIKYAYNTSRSQWTAIDDLGNIAEGIIGINSNTTRITTNTYFNLKVDKIWDDNNNQLGLRPDSFEIALLKNGEEVERKKVLESDNTVTFTNLPIEEYDEYSVREVNAPITYTPSEAVFNENTDHWEITNKIANDDILYTNIIGEKFWNNIKDREYPEKVKVNLLRDGIQYMSVETNKDAEWKYSFEKILKYKKDGSEYKFSVEEESTFDKFKTTYGTDYNGTYIKFSEQCKTYNASDYIYIYYEKDNKIYRVGPYYGNLLAGKNIEIPTKDFYIYFHTDKYNSQYYGFSIDEIENKNVSGLKVDNKESIPEEINTLPGNNLKECSNEEYPESAHTPYGNEIDDIWHYTGKDRAESPTDGIYSITNEYIEIPAKVIVHYIDKTTNKEIIENSIINGFVWDKYKVEESRDIPEYYNLIEQVGELSGEFTQNDIEIYFYYEPKEYSYKVEYYLDGEEDISRRCENSAKYGEKIISDKHKLNIDGYIYSKTNTEYIEIDSEEDKNIIKIYYIKRKDLIYSVNYLEKSTNKVLHEAKRQTGMTFEDKVTAANEVIEINGYNYDSVDKDTLVIGTSENIINIYYTKRADLGYTVNYLESVTNNVLHEPKVQTGMTFEDKVNAEEEVIAIDGYNYDYPDKYELVIGTDENVINIYYSKVTGLNYTVNYLEKGTNKTLFPSNNQGEMTFEDVINSSDEIIAIDGYNYDSVDKDTLTIGTGENVINIYYTKRNDLSYKVNYLEKNTNKVLSNQKIVNNMAFENEITSSNEVIEIDGYDYDSVDKEILKITTGENVINVYYTKRKDLSYKVNYLEKDTNKVLNEQKVVENMTYENEITSSSEVIEIDGYNYDSVDKNSLKITTGENIINIYYTKRNNLSYTVNYLEKNTNKVIHAPKVTGNMIFEDEITSVDEIITINGYSYDSVDKDKLVITTGENTINIYYTKINGLAYTVNYLEKDTDKVIHTPKTTDNMTFEDEITSADEVIEIDGYNYDSVDKDTLVIGTGENIINIYYTKRNDLSYTVNYLEKDTNKVLHGPKTQDGMTFESTVASADEVIDIDGYDYNSVDKEALTITTGENVINIYYTKRNDLSYKVNYLEKDTNKVIHDQKVVENVTFEDEILSANEVITIYGYNYTSVDKDTLVIGTKENVINIYYTKKEAKVTVHYYEENSTNKVSEDREITGKVNDEYVTAIADDIPSKYELVATPANATGTMTEDTIEVIYYFRKKATQVIVRHYEEGTTVKLSEDVTIEGRIDDPYTTVAATDVPIKYELSVTPANANGTMTEDTIEVIYYYRVKDAVLNIRYLEKNTNIELAQPEQQHGKVDEEYITGAKTIDGYTLVEHSGNERGKFEVNPLTVTYYYLYNTRATVQYIDKITGQILEQSTTEGLEGDDFVTESKSFDNYILVEEPAQKTVKMTKEEQVLKYYYIHVSGGVIEKHIDMISGEILSNDTHQGNEGDTYNIPSRTFQGYDLVEDRLPANAQGTMTVNPIEVIYYYIYKSKVTAQYVDKNTGEKLTEDEVQNGHEKDAYITDRKTFDDYKLVEVPANADGEMTKKDITVTYNYVHTSGGVIVNHVDVNTNKQLLDETKQEGYEGDPYETHEENIPGYTLVKEKYPENAKGIMAREETRVTYYYVKNTEVNIKYIDKETGEEITEKTNIPGKEGENYTTEPKDIPGYDLVEEPTNKDGTMTAEPIDVIYYYRRPAKVITRYIDQETNEEIATEEKQEGHQNDEYTTEAKDIKYYKLIATPDNATGTMKVTVTKDENGKDIVEDTTYVTYYYRKLIFNLNIDKKVSSVTVNGEESIINGDLGKVEVHRKELNTAKVEVKYIIKVTNDSELTGKASILEDIPTGMIMNAEKNEGWEVKGTTATRETKELQPGESEEYLVVLDWENGENNIGMKENTASIISTENEARFEEKDTTDNEDKADVIVAIGTGGHTYVLIAGGMLLILISLACGVYIIKKND